MEVQISNTRVSTSFEYKDSASNISITGNADINKDKKIVSINGNVYLNMLHIGNIYANRMEDMLKYNVSDALPEHIVTIGQMLSNIEAAIVSELANDSTAAMAME